MPRTLRVAAVLSLASLAAAPARAEEPLPRDPDHDVLNIRIVDVVPGMAEAAARAKKNLSFPTRDGASLRFDLYLPEPKAGAPAPPLVVFLNAGALDFPEWGQYESWCERVAADGLAAAVYAARRESALADAEDALKHLRSSGPSLGYDAARIGAFACSGNVSATGPLLADAARAGLSCVALYYGNTRDAAIPNIPFQIVRAGLDVPMINGGIAAMVAKAVEAGSDFELVEYPAGHHAFDGLDDAPRSRQVIRRTLAFWRERLVLDDAGRPERRSPARDALAFWFARDYAAAARKYRELVDARPGDGVAWYRLAQSLLATGGRDASLAPFEKAAELCPPNGEERRTSLFNVACLRATQGEKDAALAALEKAYAEGFADRAALDADPDLASLRTDPRFAALKAKVAAAAR